MIILGRVTDRNTFFFFLKNPIFNWIVEIGGGGGGGGGNRAIFRVGLPLFEHQTKRYSANRRRKKCNPPAFVWFKSRQDRTQAAIRLFVILRGGGGRGEREGGGGREGEGGERGGEGEGERHVPPNTYSFLSSYLYLSIYISVETRLTTNPVQRLTFNEGHFVSVPHFFLLLKD